MSVRVRSRMIVSPEQGRVATPVARRPSGPPSAGPELDREIERRVFGRAPARAVPPFSTQDWTASALAQLVSKQTGWSFDVSERVGIWSAIWIEHPPASRDTSGRQRILSLITAAAPTRPLAICRAILKASGCPRWPGVSHDAGLREPAGDAGEASTPSAAARKSP